MNKIILSLLLTRGRGLMLPLPQIGGMGIYPMPPVRGDMGAHPMSPPEEGGAYFCPSLPYLSPLTWELIPCSPPRLSPTLHPPLTWELIPCPPLGYLPLSTPHSHGSSSHAPPLDRGHGSSSHVPLKKEEGDEGCSRVPPLSY